MMQIIKSSNILEIGIEYSRTVLAKIKVMCIFICQCSLYITWIIKSIMAKLIRINEH